MDGVGVTVKETWVKAKVVYRKKGVQIGFMKTTVTLLIIRILTWRFIVIFGDEVVCLNF